MYRNITYAFVDMLNSISKRGSYISTRGSEQIEILSQLIQIKNPMERVIVVPNRKNNIFALIAETIWVLGGRDDLAYLSHYLPRAIDFSDNGKTWRAAYGPRLRNFNGVDQFKEIVRIINEDKNTKRAVMSIFNPQKDYVETKDVPCNNWLQFMVRNGQLHLNVTVRANDAVWGFGGINSFEWSVLQEMMAFWTGTEVGNLSWFVGTIHVYERHYETAQKIIDSFPYKTLYEFGIQRPKFSTSFSDFDKELKKWFCIEEKMRIQADADLYSEIQQIQDSFLRNSLEMLHIYNQYLRGCPDTKLAELVNQLPTNDFKIAAIEYFSRTINLMEQMNLSDKEREFFEFYNNCIMTQTDKSHVALIS